MAATPSETAGAAVERVHAPVEVGNAVIELANQPVSASASQ